MKKTLGPVSNLEPHLHSDWWHTIFDATYLKTNGDVYENDNNTVLDVELLVKAANLNLNSNILDLCCGQGRHSLELARRGFKHITGIDRSSYLISLARERASQSGLSPIFHEGDARELPFRENSFDCVAILGNSFGYFANELDDFALLEAVKRVLRPAGILVMDITDGEWIKNNFKPGSWEWIDQNYFVCWERALSEDGTRLVCREVMVHVEEGVISERFYACRLYSRERINQLLEKLGLTSILYHNTTATNSDRTHQDSGMMTCRMFLTASVPSQVTVVRQKISTSRS